MMQGGTFNLEYGRNVDVVEREVTRLLDKHDMSFLIVQEARDYWRTLRMIEGYDYFATREYPGGDQVGILVHERHVVTSIRYRPFGDGWTTVTGGHHAPITFPVLTIDNWLRVGGIHMPTPSHWVGRALEAPPERLDDYIASARAIRRFFMVPVKTRLVAGDWNEKPETTGEWSPRWIANQVNATIEAPAQVAGRGRIDYPMVKRGVLRQVHKDLEIREGSDHEPVLFKVGRNR